MFFAGFILLALIHPHFVDCLIPEAVPLPRLKNSPRPSGNWRKNSTKIPETAPNRLLPMDKKAQPQYQPKSREIYTQNIS